MNSLYTYLIPFLFFLSSCETEFIPDDIPLEAEIVVEGYIEAGENATLPFVLLTKSVPFFSEFDPNEIDNLFVHDAFVEVSDGTQTFAFEEICLDDIPDALRETVLTLLGFDLDPDAELPNICAYVDTSGMLSGQFGGSYDLRIDTGEKLITATTTIPEFVPIYGFNFLKPTEFSPDSLLELRASIDDPGGVANFYRYFTAVNSEAFQAPFQSVTDDAFFDGQSFDFPLAKAESFIDPPGIDSFGLYAIGDTARIKWATMDEENYKFWSTLEFNAVSQGPFSNYTIVDTNVEGGIGIWGGYAVAEYSIIVE